MYDTRLVVAAQEGDDAAFAALYDRNAEAVYDFCWALSGDEGEASRMVEDAFVLAARHIDDVTDASQVRPWLLAIARDRALADDEAGVLRTVWGTTPAVGAGQEVLGTGDLRRWVRESGATLALADQAVLELAARHELDADQLACAIGCDPEQLDAVVTQVDQEADEVLGALVVARQGRKDCPELAALLEGWDGAPSVEVAEQTTAHIPGCDRCSRRLSLSDPRRLVATAPRSVLPTGLRSVVLDAVAPEVAAAAARRAAGEPSTAAAALEAAEAAGIGGAAGIAGAAGAVGAGAAGALGAGAAGAPGIAGAAGAAGAAGGAGAGAAGGPAGLAVHAPVAGAAAEATALVGAVAGAGGAGAEGALATGLVEGPDGGGPAAAGGAAGAGAAGTHGAGGNAEAGRALAAATVTVPARGDGPPPAPPAAGDAKDGPPWMVIVAACLAVAVLIAIVALAVHRSPKQNLTNVSATTIPATTQPAPSSTAAAATLAPVPSTTSSTSSTVPAAGHLQLDSTSVDLGATSSSAQVLLSNTGPGSVAWHASVGPKWVSVSPGGGTLAAHGSQNVTVSVDRTTAPAGTFSVQVAFVATGTGSVGAVLSVTGTATAPTTSTTAVATTTTTPGATSTTSGAPTTTSSTAPGH